MTDMDIIPEGKTYQWEPDCQEEIFLRRDFFWTGVGSNATKGNAQPKGRSKTQCDALNFSSLITSGRMKMDSSKRVLQCIKIVQPETAFLMNPERIQRVHALTRLTSPDLPSMQRIF